MNLSPKLVVLLVVLGGLGAMVSPALAVDVLYVIGGDQAQNGLDRPGDILVNDFFVDRGYTVLFMDEEVPGADMLGASNAADLTYISESVSSSNVTNKVTSSPTGVITTEAFLQDDLLFTQNDDCCRGDTSDQTSVDIVDNLGQDFPLGVIPVFNPAGRIGWGMPEGDVSSFATIVGEPTQIADYVYEAGDTLIDGSVAAGQRVFMGSMTGLTLDPNPVWTAEGQALFGAAVDFAMIPEPSSIVLLFFGLAGLLARRRRA